MAVGDIRSALVASVAIYAAAAAMPAQAQTRTFNVPAQRALTGIPEFARQADIQILVGESATRGRNTRAVRGRMSVGDGLRRLLDGSGLRISSSDGRTFTLSGSAASGEAQAGSAAADSGSANQEGYAEILVVGSRSQNADIVRTENDAQPYVVFSRDQLQQSSSPNLEDFLRKNLPMNTQQGTNGQVANSNGSNVSQINLRGLGVNQTLVLVDGRRAPRTLFTSGDELTQADINGIPLSAIERIEILPSTAGGIYGGGAVGGVINIIRRRDYSGLDVRLSYSQPFRGGGESLRAEVTGGFTPNHGSTRISFSASHSRMNPLYVGDNDLWRAGRILFDRNDALHFPFAGYTPNIQSTTRVNLVLDNGTPLNANRTYIPIGYAGTQADGGLALVPNAGRYNLELSNDRSGRFASLLNNPDTYSANLNVRQSVGRRVELFLDLDYQANRGNFLTTTTVFSATIAANAANNPFRQAIRVFFPIIGIDHGYKSQSTNMGLLAGAVVNLGGGWYADLEQSLRRSRFISREDNVVLNAAGRAAVNNGTIDVLRDVNAYPINWTPYLVAPLDYSVRGPFDNNNQITSFRASGPLFAIRGNRAALTLLAERDRVSAARGESRVLLNGGETGVLRVIIPARTQVRYTTYAELRVPIVAADNALPFVHALEFQASLRRDWYRTTVASPRTISLPNLTDPEPALSYDTSSLSSTNYTLAARWEVTPGLTLRASRSTGFLPPELAQLVPITNIVNQTGFLDPRRGNEEVGFARDVELISGGNPNLQPESSTSLALGVIFAPRALPGLRLSVDYTRIRKRGEIADSFGLDILGNEDAYPGRVVRGPNLPGDQPGWAGPVTFLDTSLINISRSRIEAVDFQADYDFRVRHLGSVHIFGVGTLQTDLVRRRFPNSPAIDLVGFTDGPLRWRLTGGVEWSSGGWRLAWNSQYYDSYSVQSSFSTNNTSITLNGRERIPTQTYHDLNIGYRFDQSRGILSGLELLASVENVLDRHPPVVAARLYGYSGYGDPRLRRFTITLRKHFGH